MRPQNGAARGWPWALGLLCVLVATQFALVHPYFDPTPDACLYIATARSLVAGEGYSYLGQPFTLRPPGFALLLAPLLALQGTSFLAFNWLVSCCGVAAAAFLFVHAKNRMGAPLASLLSLALWLNPSFQRFSTQVMSDVPGLALLLVCLLVERWSRRRTAFLPHLLLGVAVAAAAYVRTMSALLIPAILAARLWTRTEPRPSRWTAVLPAAIALLALVPWFLRSGSAQEDLAGDQLFLHSYKTALFHADPTDPDSPFITWQGFLARIGDRSKQVVASLGNRMSSEESTGLLSGSALVLCLLVALVRRREPAEIFALAALLILSTYFAFRTRLALSVYALALCSAADVLHLCLRRFLGRKPAELTVAALLLGLIALDWRPREHWPDIARDHALRVESAAQLERLLPEEALLAGHNGLYYEVYLERPVLRIRILRDRAGFAAVEHMLRERQVDFLLIDEALPDSGAFLEWAGQRYGESIRCGETQVFPVNAETPLR